MKPSSHTGLPPWHLWGGTIVTNAVSGGVVTTPHTTQQLARVSYKRPETWTFFFATRILANVTPGGVAPGNLLVNFDLTLGVGRTQVTIPGFVAFNYLWGAGGPTLNSFKFASSTQTPTLDDQAATPVHLLMQEFPAQDIQLQTTITLNTPSLGDTLTVEVSGYFAPRTHIRPEWFVQEFAAGEERGAS